MQFPIEQRQHLTAANDAAHREQFATFDDYIQELIREARFWKADGEITGSCRVKGVTTRTRMRDGTTTYEARCRSKLVAACMTAVLSFVLSV